MLTPERVAELLDEGVTLATLEILHEIEGKWSPPVRMKSERQSDGTWKLLLQRDYDAKE